MHETSPGQVEEHELSIRSDNKSELNGAKTKTNVYMERTTMKAENVDDDGDVDSSLRIYDDPCDLMDDVPIFRMARSRSWFCCPSSESTVAPPTSIFHNRCPEYSLVTEAPKIKLHTVCGPVARKRRRNSIFFR